MMMQRAILLAMAITLGLATQSTAQNGDLDLINSGTPPNVVILMDTSGSMNIALRHASFDNTAAYDTDQSAGASGTRCSIPGIATLTGGEPNNDELYYEGGSGWGTTFNPAWGRYPDTFYCTSHVSCSNVPAGWSCSNSGPSGWSRTIRIPNTSTVGRTYYSRNYMHWIMNQVLAGTKPVLPTEDRMMAAKDAITTLVNRINVNGQPDKVKFGLARYEPGYSPAPAGGRIIEPAVLNNKLQLLSTLNSLAPNGYTPLAETMVDIGRYFAGTSGNLGTYTSYNRTDISGTVPDSPIDKECELNFIIAVTDGLPTYDDHDHASTRYDGTFGDADFDGVVDYANGDFNNDGLGRDPGNDPVLDIDFTLVDVAGYLHGADLSPFDGTQSVITYTVGFAIDHDLLQQAATAGGGVYFQPNNADELADSLTGAINDIIKRSTSLTAATVPTNRTAFNDGYYTAYFVPVGAKPFWQGHLEAYRLAPDLTVMGRPYVGAPGLGSLYGLPAIDPVTNQFITPSYPFWDAAGTSPGQLLDAGTTRRLLTHDAGTVMNFDITDLSAHAGAAPGALGTLFGLADGDWANYPRDNTAVVPDPYAGCASPADKLACAVIDFTHGIDSFDDDADLDHTDLREWVLGDIFHSNPLLIGPPPSALANQEGFGPAHVAGTFMNLRATRDRVLYVGANDGMLHAFNAGQHALGDNPVTPETEIGYYTLGTGAEIFGFIPRSLWSKIPLLPREDQSKQYFVDGSPAAADIHIDYNLNGIKEGTEWTTTLITGLREGGTSYTALDVTDPSASSGNHGPFPRLMWEVEASATLKLGQTWSEPVFARVKLWTTPGTGDACGGNCISKTVVVVGGGYTLEGDPNLLNHWQSAPSGSPDPVFEAGKAVYILEAATGNVLARLEYDAADTHLSRMIYAIPSTPAVIDYNADGFADLIYIGDLGGQLWKWDLRANGFDLDADSEVDNWPAQVAFAATPVNIGDVDSNGTTDYHYKSIFYPPAGALLDGHIVLTFGSGERNNILYEGTGSGIPGTVDDNNRFWVLYDKNEPLGATPFANMPLDEGDLTNITNTATDSNPNDYGYYFLVDDGVKFMTNHEIFAGYVLTLAYYPDNTSALAGCGAAGQTLAFLWNLEDGSGFFDPANSSTGNQSRSLSMGNGAPSDPQIAIKKGSASVTSTVSFQFQTSTKEKHDEDTDVELPPVSMVYWRQYH